MKCEVQVSVELRVVWEPFNSESIRSSVAFPLGVAWTLGATCKKGTRT